MIEILNRMVLEAYAEARAKLAAEGRRIESVSVRLDEDGSTLTRDGTRVVFTFDTSPIRPPWASTSCAPAETEYELPPRDPFDPDRDWRHRAWERR